jgi:hypothetical protein
MAETGRIEEFVLDFLVLEFRWTGAIVRSDLLCDGRLNPHSHMPELPFRRSSAREFLQSL